MDKKDVDIHMNKKTGLAGIFLRRFFLTALVILVFLGLCGCQENDLPAPPSEPQSTTVVPTESTPTEPVETAPPATEPPIVPVSGNPDEVSCRSSYSATENEAVLAAHDTVAVIGGEELTNAHLQVYYWMAVSNYRAGQHEIAPDFSLPLDQQICELSGEPMTWQQYFLEQALHAWHSFYAMTMTSRTAQTPVEEAYKPNAKKHAENISPEIYNIDLLYGYDPTYKMADAHREYLEQLPETLEQLAVELGYEDMSGVTKDFAGIATSSDYLQQYAELANEGYMYATTLSYYIEPTAEEVESYFAENEEAYAEKGITRTGGKYVNIRHILVTPESSKETGLSAKELLKKWQSDATEANFAELAFAYSADTGSNVNGGLYAQLSKGQLTEELDAWCFDDARQSGDTTIISTDSGDHILHFCGTTDIWFSQAEKDLSAHLLARQIGKAMESHPMEVDYSAVRLGQPRSDASIITTADVLYPDIAHERFPEAPLYLQQDYEGTMYGNFSLVTYGCGITTMSMLTSYMTDDEWTPPEMCALYGKYCTEKGTAHAMFNEVPTDRGFYLIERIFTWKEALAYLEEGYMVVTLQRDGYWTRGGHYLLLHNLIETGEGTKIQVRDSNILNYGKLDGHTTGYFNLETIPGNARCYWVYQKKVTRVDSCVRCGEPTEESLVPGDFFAADYYCAKCHRAMNRRDAYIDACFGLI